MSRTSEKGWFPTTIANESTTVDIPDWVIDLGSFRRWMDSDDLPEHVRIWYIKGRIWVDMSRQQVFTHAVIKKRITTVLDNQSEAAGLGLVFADGVLLSNEAADLSGNPDALFASTGSLKAKKVRLVEGQEEGYVELEGSPDMVLEVVSSSSVRKDTVVLRRAYWEAGIREYWLVDARREPLSFDILRHTAKGYVATRKQDGWIKSAVFGKAFRLTQGTDPLGHPTFTLDVR